VGEVRRVTSGEAVSVSPGISLTMGEAGEAGAWHELAANKTRIARLPRANQPVSGIMVFVYWLEIWMALVWRWACAWAAVCAWGEECASASVFLLESG
jgi:hypothetical protein